MKFEEGNIYTMTFAGDSELKPKFICIKRTAKMATFEAISGNEVVTKKIKEFNGVEMVRVGSYSMAPSIYADKVVG